jgi:hypothetical protein
MFLKQKNMVFFLFGFKILAFNEICLCCWGFFFFGEKGFFEGLTITNVNLYLTNRFFGGYYYENKKR